MNALSPMRLEPLGHSVVQSQSFMNGMFALADPKEGEAGGRSLADQVEDLRDLAENTGKRIYGLEADHLEEMERLRILWENERNPVYVWRGIGLCFGIALHRYRAEHGKVPPPPWTAAAAFPPWVLGYLSIVSVRIEALAEGVDFRNTPAPFGNAPNTPESDREYFEEPSFILEGGIKGQKAAELLPSALGFTEKGRNAFDRARSLKRKEFDDLSFADLREKMSSDSEAKGALVEESKFEEISSIDKRLRSVKRAYGVLPRGRKSKT